MMQPSGAWSTCGSGRRVTTISGLHSSWRRFINGLVPIPHAVQGFGIGDSYRAHQLSAAIEDVQPGGAKRPMAAAVRSDSLPGTIGDL
jgi:hypothetical protein